MKKIFSNLLPVLCFALMISSCNKKDKTGLLVPKNAALVMHFSSSSFSSKLSWEDIKATNWYKKINSQVQDTMAGKLMNDPASSGLDMKSDFVYFIQMRKNGAHLVIDGKLKDAAAFETYCKKMMPGSEMTKEGSFTTGSAGHGMALVWNKEWFAVVMELPGMNKGMPFGKKEFMQSMPDEDEKDLSNHFSEFNTDSLKKVGKDILSLSDTKTLGTDSRFAELIKEPGDIHIWVNMEKFYSAGTMGSMMSMMKVNTLLEGSVYAASISFENGKIAAKGKYFAGKEMDRLIKKYPPKPVDAALINRLPSENVMAALAINYSPEGLQEFLKMIGVDGLLNLFLGKMNFNLDDFVKANKGEMLFALTGVENKDYVDSFTTGDTKRKMMINMSKPEIKFLLANAINNKGSFDRLLELLKGGDGELHFGRSENFTYQVKDNWFVAGDQANITSFLSGTNNNVSFASRISGHPIGCYIDIQKILKSASRNIPDSKAESIYNASMEMWQDVVITGGDYKDGAVIYSAEVNLVNKNTNSLKQLNNYLDQIAGIYTKRLAFDENDGRPLKIDSLMLAPKSKTK